MPDFGLNMSPGAVNSPGSCWVCGCVMEDRHHVFPRAYGGEKGPTVDLCQTHHRLVHDLAERDSLAAGRIPQEHEAAGRTMFLAGCIETARNAVKDDPNKSTMFMSRLPPATAKQLRQLAKFLKRPQKAVVNMAVNELHKTVFGAGKL